MNMVAPSVTSNKSDFDIMDWSTDQDIIDKSSTGGMKQHWTITDGYRCVRQLQQSFSPRLLNDDNDDDDDNGQ